MCRLEQRMKQLAVGSVVIYWPESELVITDTSGQKHTLPLDQSIRVTMIGHPAEEQKNMIARELGDYIDRAYIILQIEYEER